MFLLLLAASRAELHMGLLLLLSHCLPREFVELTLWGRLRRDNPSPLDGNSQQQPWAPDTSSRPPRVGAHEHGPAPHRQILGLQGWNADWATTARLSGLQRKPQENSRIDCLGKLASLGAVRLHPKLPIPTADQGLCLVVASTMTSCRHEARAFMYIPLPETEVWHLWPVSSDMPWASLCSGRLLRSRVQQQVKHRQSLTVQTSQT